MESTDNEKVKAPEQEAALDKKGLLRPSVEESKENTNETQKQESARNTRWKPLRVLILLMCMNFLTYVDRGAINACLTEIKVDKIIASTTALTGLKTGSLVSVFMIGYMLTCPVFVHLQDWILPTRLMAIGLTVWIIALIMTTFAMNYSFLIVARALVGIGEAAYAGFTATIIDDMAPRETRTMWLAGFYAMIPVGQASGIAFGGFLSTKVLFGYEGWRTAFGIQAILMVPILFLLLSLPVWCNPREVLELQRLRKKKKASKIISDVAATNEVVSIRTSGGAAPIAGQSESAERTPLVSRPNGEDDTAVSENSDTPHSYTITESICMLFTNGAYVAIILGYAFYTFTLGAIAVWSVEYLVSGPVRTEVTKASLSFGISTLLTGVIGTAFGGKVIDWMGGSSGFDGAIKCTVFNALNVLLSMPMGFGALLMRHLWSFYMFFTPAEWFMFNTTAPVNAAIISVVPPSLRTHAMSYSVLIIHAIGDFPSAVVAGYLNDVFSFGCQGKKTQDICESFSKDCYWKPATADSQAVCVNEYQLRNSLFVIVSVSLLTSIMWFSAWLLIKREKCKQTIERNQAIQ